MTAQAKEVFMVICKCANELDGYMINADLKIIDEETRKALKELVDAQFIERVKYIGQHYIQCRICAKGIEYYINK